MLNKAYLIVLFFLVITGCSTIKDNSYNPDFSNSEITLVNESIPFNTYKEWLNDTKGKKTNFKRLDRFQKLVDPKAFSHFKKTVASHWISYQSDGLKIAGVVAYPKKYSGEKLPVVIFNRGGNDSGGNSRISLYKLIFPLAEQGYIVLASNYRGSKFSEGKDEFGGKDVNDVLRLVDIVDTISFADKTRIGMVGWSRGAMMTLQAARKSNKIKTAVVVAGSVDYFSSLERRPSLEKKVLARLVPNLERNRKVELEKRSAIFWLEELNPKMPILVMHGKEDWQVDYGQSKILVERLSELKHPFKFESFEYGNHSLTFYKKEWQSALYAWLKGTL
jgi:dipeptidyl aminopeptidase/acylaminoacyl peptidase